MKMVKKSDLTFSRKVTRRDKYGLADWNVGESRNVHPRNAHSLCQMARRKGYRMNRKADDSGWTTAGVTTRATNELSNLVVASRYYFRMAAVTPDNTSDFCSPVTKIIV